MDYIEKHVQSSEFYGYHIRGFEDLITNGLASVIQKEHIVEIQIPNSDTYVQHRIENITVHAPTIIHDNRSVYTILPAECMQKDLTYQGNVSVDLTTIVFNKQGKVIDCKVIYRYPLFKLPIMIGSSVCNSRKMNVSDTTRLEDGVSGYFIIRGKERVLVSQERMNYNKFIVHTFKSPVYTGEIRSMSNETRHSVSVLFTYNIDTDECHIKIPQCKVAIPVTHFIRVVVPDIQNIRSVFNQVLLYPVSKLNSDVLTDKALLFMRKIEYTCNETSVDDIVDSLRDKMMIITSRAHVYTVLRTEVFPHLPINSDEESVLGCSARCIRHLLMVVAGTLPLDHKDNLVNKRVETSGPLILDIFRMAYKRFIRQIVVSSARNFNLRDIIPRVNNLTRDIRYAFSTGNWGSNKSSYVRTGVSQVVCRFSHIAMLSHLHRVVVPIGREIKSTEMRHIHQSSVFFIDATETPEGGCVGIVKNLALLTDVSVETCTIHTSQYIIKLLNVSKSNGLMELCVNDRCYGTTNDKNAVQKIRDARDSGMIDEYVSVSCVDTYTIRVYTDGGRMVRPLIRLSDRKIIKLDALELEECIIAMTEADITPRTTHVEIHPVAMLGIVSATIPFIEHNQSPRVCYYTNMGKQSISVFTKMWRKRLDTSFNILMAGQNPLVTTTVSRSIASNDMPTGMNCMVAIACYGGWNQEDSIIMNRASVENGMFLGTSFRTITIDDKRPSAHSVISIEAPTDGVKKVNVNYKKLDSNGVVLVGTHVVTGDVLVSRTTTKTVKDKVTITDSSVVVTPKEEGIVDRVEKVPSSEGFTLVKIRIRNIKIPEVGDKFCSRCHDDQTEILTDYGWMFFKDLNGYERVCTLVDGKVCYEKPVDYHAYSVTDREMCVFQDKNVDMVVTSNHKMYTRMTGRTYKSHEASEIVYKKAWLSKSGDNPHSTNSWVTINNVKIKTKLWLNLVAAKISYGDKIPVECVQHVFDSIGIDTVSENGYVCTPIHGNIPWNMDAKHSACLLNFLLGMRRSWSEELAGDIQRLALHAEKSVSVIQDNDVWRIMKNDDHVLWDGNKNGKTVLYTGIVYCVEVEPSHIIYTRRNGKACWGMNSSQKSTIGLLMNKEDLPFTSDGITPDIIMNPAGMPSRMTCAQILETVVGKKCLEESEEDFDASPWSGALERLLEKIGHREYGHETMYNGMTGEKMLCRIFIGPTFYHRLKHMVSDKMYARSYGSVQTLTQQPGSGRSRQGALRVGEMESTSMASQGASTMLLDRLYDASDAYHVMICVKCGQTTNNQKYCTLCESDDLRMVKIPYAFKLLTHLLTGLGIRADTIPES